METKNIFKPILFSTEMVQAILAGKKTQTRRIVKPQPSYFPYTDSKEGHEKTLKNYIDEDLKHGAIKGKYHIGDILWVRETHKIASWNSDEDKVSFYYKASPGENFPMVNYDPDEFEKIFEKTISELDRLGEGEIDNEECTVTYKFPAGDNPLKWKPSLFMPKEAARIFLKVTKVRCEKLQDISEGDAIAEGVKLFDTNLYKDYEDNKSPGLGKARVSFATLWDSINAKKHPWKSNPWVWVYDFERIEKPENFI